MSTHMHWCPERLLLPLLVVVSASTALAEPAAEIEGVKAASKAFYAAVVVVDDGTAMEKVWAHRPYVTYVGPRNTSVIRGWEAQKKYWAEFNKAFAARSVELVDAHVHAVGNLAWEVGAEVGQAQMRDGSTRKVDWLVTNIYEKIDGHWFMVSHHVQPKPQ
jgi:ketosteroid isomerase-like protein